MLPLIKNTCQKVDLQYKYVTYFTVNNMFTMKDSFHWSHINTILEHLNDMHSHLRCFHLNCMRIFLFLSETICAIPVPGGTIRAILCCGIVFL